MYLLRDIVLFMIIAVGLGIGSAYLGITNAEQLDRFDFGPWSVWPQASGPSANPYAKANQAQNGALLEGTGEGIAFVAKSDNDGTPLDGACQYQVVGGDLPARLWTLSLITEDGELVDSPSYRHSFHSRNIARTGSANYEIVTGPEVMAGNWLQSENSGSFKLVLRLYETQLASGGGFGAIKLPDIAWVSCE